jgi:hypothetical protein
VVRALPEVIRALRSFRQLNRPRLAPEYERAAQNMAGLVNFAALDCDEDSNKPLCVRPMLVPRASISLRQGQYGVQGFPTIKVSCPAGVHCSGRQQMFPGAKRKSPRGASLLVEVPIRRCSQITTARGRRRLWQTMRASLHCAVTPLTLDSADQMPSHVKKLKTATELEDLLASEVSHVSVECPRLKGNQRTGPIAVLITSSAQVTPLYKGLSAEFRNKMTLYAIKDSADLADLKARFSVAKAPSLLVFAPGSKEPETFKGVSGRSVGKGLTRI